MRVPVLVLASLSFLAPMATAAQAPVVLTPATRIRFSIAPETPASDCTPSDWICFPRGATAAAGAVAFGLVGAGVGAIVGWVNPVERWNHAILPAEGTVTIRRGRSGGRSYGVAFRVRLPTSQPH